MQIRLHPKETTGVIGLSEFGWPKQSEQAEARKEC